MFHDLIDLAQGHSTTFANRVHPIGAWIVLGGIGLITGAHLICAAASLVYTALCGVIKWREHRKKMKE